MAMSCRRVENESDVRRVLEGGEPETAQLDYKGDWSKGGKGPPAAREFVKDVAAMMNGDGGVILLGITEDNQTSRAQHISGKFSLQGAKTKAMDWLRAWGSPDDIDAFVELAEFPGMSFDGHNGDVLAINVSPYPHGPVAVPVDKHREGYKVPVRMGPHTRFLSWSEIGMRFADVSRSSWIRAEREVDAVAQLAQCLDKKVPISLHSPVAARVMGVVRRATLPIDHAHGRVEGLSPDSLTLRVDRLDLVGSALRPSLQKEFDRNAYERFTALSERVKSFRFAPESRDAAEVLRDEMGPGAIANGYYELTVPWNLVQSTWCDKRRRRWSVMLSALLCWEVSGWNLMPQN